MCISEYQTYMHIISAYVNVSDEAVGVNQNSGSIT
jgi:hypothetical protein